MMAILAITLLYLVLEVVLLVSAVLIGLVLHWLFPDMSMGHGILIGLLSTIASAYLLAQMGRIANLSSFNTEGLDEDDEDWDDDDDDYDDEGPDDTLPDTRRAPPLTSKEHQQRAGKRR